MTGNRREDMDDSLYGVYPEATNPYGGRQANSGPGYPPPDPWADDGYGGARDPRNTYGGGQTRPGQPSSVRPNPYGGAGRDTGRGGAARPGGGWDDDGGWDDEGPARPGSGDTRGW
jgi:hypothetical protein